MTLVSFSGIADVDSITHCCPKTRDIQKAYAVPRDSVSAGSDKGGDVYYCPKCSQQWDRASSREGSE